MDTIQSQATGEEKNLHKNLLKKTDFNVRKLSIELGKRKREKLDNIDKDENVCLLGSPDLTTDCTVFSILSDDEAYDALTDDSDTAPVEIATTKLNVATDMKIAPSVATSWPAGHMNYQLH